MRYPTLFALTAALAAAPVAARDLPVAAVALVINGEPAGAGPNDADALDVWEAAVPLLRERGFRILATAEPDDLIGGAALGSAEIGWLHIDHRAPGLEFNLVLLPPRWSKRKVGEMQLVDAHSGKKLWSESIKVKFLTRKGRERNEAGLQRIEEMLSELTPAAGSGPRLGGSSRSSSTSTTSAATTTLSWMPPGSSPKPT